MIEFILPDIGEGIETVSVSDILVKENQIVSENDSVLLVETDKASMEIPIDCSGVIKEIFVNTGDLISPGQKIFTLSQDESTSIKSTNEDDIQIDKNSEEKNESIEDIINEEVSEKHVVLDIPDKNDSNIVHASPSARKLARQLNFNINDIDSSGNNQRVTKEDVEKHKDRLINPIKNTSDKVNDNLFDSLSKWGLVEKVDLNSIQNTSARRLHDSWMSIPHVTQFDECDITNLDKLIRTLKKVNKNKNAKVSYIPFFIKSIYKVLKEMPIFNSSLNSDKKSILKKNYFNIGIAVDTPKGLVVPVIKNVNSKSLKKLTIEFNNLINKARQGKLTIDDMSGGCITISSLGNIGGKYFTPIINKPEVAILGISSIDIKPIYKNNKFVARKMLPISLSYDHRVINGADAAKFTRLFSKFIDNPSLL